MTRLADYQADGRPGVTVRKRLRRDVWEAVRKRRGTLAAVTTGWTVMAVGLPVGLSAAGVPGGASLLLMGFTVGLLPFLFQHFLIGEGFAQRSLGADAEEWTAHELSRLGSAWTVFHDVPVTVGNVDHVAVGPGRVYAIETKWTSSQGRFLEGAMRQAERGARDVQHRLRRSGHDRDVIPILVVWGPGVANSLGPKPSMRSESRTRIVAGAHAPIWRRRMIAAASDSDPDSAAIESLIKALQDRESMGAKPGKGQRRERRAKRKPD